MTPARGDDTRARVLQAALRIYARGGEAGFGVHAIVAESGVSLGSVYHHFGSMEGLCAALYARCMEELLSELAEALDRVRSARSGTHAVVRAYLAHARRRPAVARFIHASAYAAFVPEHAAIIAAAKAPALARIGAFFRAHVEARRIVALPDALLEVLLIGPVAEVTRRWLAGAADVNLDTAARWLPERTWQSLAPRARSARAQRAPRNA